MTTIIIISDSIPKQEPATEPATATLKLEAGKRYVRHDGGVTGPLEHSKLRDYPFRDPLSYLIYTTNGLRDCCDRGRDLVAEYVEPAAEPAKLTLEVGKRYVRRDGIVTNPLIPFCSDTYSFADPHNKIIYTRSGKWVKDSGDHALDLVSEYVEVSKENLASALRDIVACHDVTDWSCTFRAIAKRSALNKARELLAKLES